MTPTIHTGCSSFNSSTWKGIFYPEDLPRSQWFSFYTQHFSTYEINATFYRAPTVKSLKAWHDKAPQDFVFSVKAPKTITHIKKFVDCETEISQFYETCREGLQGKLGCILFQLPPSFAFSDEKLALILSAVNADFDNVIEFRNESWWIPKVYDAFEKKNLTLCNVSYPKLPEKLVPTSTFGYVRLHGVPKLFYSGYSDETLKKLDTKISDQKQWTKVFVYFNNTASKDGILNALTLKKLTG